MEHWGRKSKQVCLFLSVLIACLSISSILSFNAAHAVTASVGKPSRGSLVEGIPFPDQFRGYTLYRHDRSYATPELIGALLDAIEGVKEKYPDAPDVFLGDFSFRKGGPIRPHRSHQNGRDVDIGLYAKGNRTLKRFVSMNDSNLDVPKTWCLIENLLRSQRIQYIFVDRRIQEPLFKYALAQGFDRDYLDRLFKNVGQRHRGAIIQHLGGHRNHLHVRFITPWSTLAGQLRKIDPHRRAAIELAQQAYLPKKVNYYVKGSEGSLKALARSFGVSLKDLCRWNDLKGDEVLTPGSCLVFYKRSFEVEPVRLAHSLKPDLPAPIRLASFKIPSNVLSDVPPSPSSFREEDVKADAREGERDVSSGIGYSTYTVRKGDTLNGIARKHEVPSEALCRLNGIRRDGVLKVGDKLKIAAVKTKVASVKGSSPHRVDGSLENENGLATVSLHKVQKGETLFAIARKYGMEPENVGRLNGLDQEGVLKVGQTLKVVASPRSPSSERPSSLSRERIVSEASSLAKATKPEISRKSVDARDEDTASGDDVYRVEAGDTLLGIAIRHGMKVDRLRRLNGLERDSVLRAGRELKVRGSEGAPKVVEDGGDSEAASVAAMEEARPGPADASGEAGGGVYRVEAGDTLLGIAIRHGMKVDRLCRLNGLERDSVLRAGRELEIEHSTAEGEGAVSREDATPAAIDGDTGIYVVLPGDTLLGIAIKNRMKTEALCELNGLKRGSALKPGRKLRVRGSASVAESQGISREASENLDLYKVRKGDTLWGLARKHETSTEAICRLNGLTKEATLKPEMEIKVPSGL